MKTEPVTHKISSSTISRLFLYYRALLELRDRNVISSEELAKLTDVGAALIRRDLTSFGQFGVPARGYDVARLRDQIRKILGINRKWNVALVGLGYLGNALLRYKGFSQHSFKVVEIFDNDTRKIGKDLAGVKVRDIKELSSVIKAKRIKMAVITVPAESAQSVAGLLVEAGVKAILNFAPVCLKIQRDIRILNIDMTNELTRLSYYLTQENRLGIRSETESKLKPDEPVLSWL